MKFLSLLLVTTFALPAFAADDAGKMPEPRNDQERYIAFLYNKTKDAYDHCKEVKPGEFLRLKAAVNMDEAGVVRDDRPLAMTLVTNVFMAYDAAGGDCDKILAVKQTYTDRLVAVRNAYLASIKEFADGAKITSDSIWSQDKNRDKNKFQRIENECLSKVDVDWAGLKNTNSLSLKSGLAENEDLVEAFTHKEKAAQRCAEMTRNYLEFNARALAIEAYATKVFSEPIAVK